jgi:hypothetical protein
MKDMGNLHLKVQEMIDCYSTTDPLKEMSVIASDQDKAEAAVKWLALTALHGVNNNAKKITIERQPGGGVTVTAEYRDTELPSPGPDVAENIFSAVRGITHIEGEEGKSQLALGMKDSSIDLRIKVKTKSGKEEISIKFDE